MRINKVFPFLVLLLVASISITACSPKASPDQPSLPPAEQPTELPTENPFNPAILGDCYNPFFPVMEGKVWKYAVVSGGVSSTLEVSYKDVTPSFFTSVQQFPDIRTEIQWSCGPDGMLSSQLANMSIAQIPDIKYEIVEMKGVLFPKEDKWQVGNSWGTSYVIKIEYTSGETVLEGQGNIEISNTIAAVEPITVLSGTYNDAFRVDTSGTIIINISGMGTDISMPITNTTWHVKDVGLVKSISANPSLTYSSSMELASLE